MIKKFNTETFNWEGVDTLVYKQDGSPFKDVTRRYSLTAPLTFPANSVILK